MANVPSTFERKWPTVILTPIGVANYIVTVSSTAGLHTKQQVTLSLGAAVQDFEIKRILSDTQLQVGATDTGIASYQNPTQFDGGILTMSEQERNKFDTNIVLRAVYAEEPAVALRNVLVNQFGTFIDSVKDSKGINRLAVDGQFTATVDVQVAVDIEGEYNSVTNPNPDDVGLIVSTRNTSPGRPNQTQRPTAIRGSVDINTVSQDVSLHDQFGNGYTFDNPLPTINDGYDKLFTLVAATKFLALANPDSIVPTYSNGGKTAVLSYYESGALVGQATVNNNSATDWNISLAAYINDADGSQLQDDDGSELILE